MVVLNVSVRKCQTDETELELSPTRQHRREEGLAVHLDVFAHECTEILANVNADPAFRGRQDFCADPVADLVIAPDVHVDLDGLLRPPQLGHVVTVVRQNQLCNRKTTRICQAWVTLFHQKLAICTL